MLYLRSIPKRFYDSPHMSSNYSSFLPLIFSLQDKKLARSTLSPHSLTGQEEGCFTNFFLQLPHWCSNLILLLRCPKVLPCTERPMESNTELVSTGKKVVLFSCGGARGLLASSDLLSRSRKVHSGKRKLREK